MPTWIIDDGPFGDLARFIKPQDLAHWPTGQLFIAEQTAQDAQQSHARKALLEANPTPFQTFCIMMETPAAQVLYSHLRTPGPGATANLAEHQSIAWAISARKDAVFVVVDRSATLLALAELGCGRVAHAHDLWLHLLSSKLIDQEQFKSLCEATSKKDQSKIPLRCQDLAP